MVLPTATVLATVQRLGATVLRRLLELERDGDHATARLMVLSIVGCIGLPLFYVVWRYWFPQAYENLGLRLFGVALCLPAFWATRLLGRRALDLYVMASVTYVLPFFFTFMFLMNHGAAVWSLSLLIVVMVLFQFDPGWALRSLLAGTTLGCIAFALAGDPAFLLSVTVLEQLPIYVFTIIVVLAAKLGTRALAHERLNGMADALAAVSHELRTPLVSVNANVRGIKRLLARDAHAVGACAGSVDAAVGRIESEVHHMQHLISMFLLSARAVNQQPEAVERLGMQAMVGSVLRQYPFNSAAERALVTVELRQDFEFDGQRELCVVVLLNLLRNALKALQRAGQGSIRILIDGSTSRPRLQIIDTGCGIAQARVGRIFDRFYSFPAGAGTGIGLTLCKDILRAWDASISCVSREMAYTIFTIDFRPTGAAPVPSTFRTEPCDCRSISTPA